MLEELDDPGITLVSKLGVLLEHLLHLSGQDLDEVLSARVLDRHFDHLVTSLNHTHHTVRDRGLDALTTQQLVQGRLILELDSRGTELIELGLEETAEALKLSSQFGVFFLEGTVLHCSNGESLEFSLGNGRVVDCLEGSTESHDLILQLSFSLSGPAQLLLQVLDPLLKLNDLVLLLVDEERVVEDATGRIGSGRVDLPLHQSVDFRLKEVETLVEFLMLVAVEDKTTTFLAPFSLEVQQDVPEGSEVINVRIARDDDLVGLGLFIL